MVGLGLHSDQDMIKSHNITITFDVAGSTGVKTAMRINADNNVFMNGGLNVASGQSINIRDQWHGMVYDQSVDGPHIRGFGGGKLGSGAKAALTWNAQGEVTVNAGGNPLKFGSQWQEAYNKATNNAYILNDKTGFNSLMFAQKN